MSTYDAAVVLQYHTWAVPCSPTVLLEQPRAQLCAHGSGARLRLRGGEELACRAVVGADGVRSAVAAKLGVPPPNLAGYTAYRHDFADELTTRLLLDCLMIA